MTVEGRHSLECLPAQGGELLNVSTSLFAIPLASQRFLGSPFFTRLEIKRVPLDLFDNIFLLDFTLEPPEGAFYCLAVL